MQPLDCAEDTYPNTIDSLTKRIGANRKDTMYRVYYYTDSEEQYEGFFETQEEAEEVAHCASDDYEADCVEVRDRFDNIIFQIGDRSV